MPTWFGDTIYDQNWEAKRKASTDYYISIGCSKWKAEELARSRGFKKKHEAFYRAPKKSKRLGRK